MFLIFIFVVFFFKQKTAYEMRISDWSSDVCSSDLALSVFGQVNDEALTLRDSIASLLGAVDDVRNIPRTLALKAGERFKEETGLTLPQSWLVGDSQASNMRGRFVSGFDASRRRLTG